MEIIGLRREGGIMAVRLCSRCKHPFPLDTLTTDGIAPDVFGTLCPECVITDAQEKFGKVLLPVHQAEVN